MSKEDEEWSYAPWNFSWIVKDELAAMAWPQSPENLRYLQKEGIKHVVTLSPEKRPPIHAFPDLKWTEIAIKEFRSPSVSQIKKFIDVCQRCKIKNEPVGVHCRMGRGRTGVMAACYLIHFYKQSPERALINLRLMRPGSVETHEQEKAVGVHCRMGRGRTGVMAACFLVHFYDHSPEGAITKVRIMRPGSVETYEQEKAVKAYHDYLRSI